jgi:glutamate/tyrosine decarboxylase-like PLP-dependent enzyme
MTHHPSAEPLNAALRHAQQYLSASHPVAATATLGELHAQICLPLNEDSLDPTEVIDDLVRSVEGGLHDSAGPRFFGWVIGGSLPAALAADWLTSVWDQNAGLYACAPAAAIVEEACGGWLKQILRLPVSVSFALVTACQMAHLTCLMAARHAVLGRKQWNVERDGLTGAPPIRILTSTEKHGTIVRAVQMLGLGANSIVVLPVDDHGRLRADALEAALATSPEQATIVVLQAGDLNLGAFDDFNRLVPIAKQYGAWVHIDGAFGLWANASPKLRHLLNGAEDADSWSTDGHKWLNVPYDCGYAFVADQEAHRASLSYAASYITYDDTARDQVNWNPEWSRRGRGFATYAALRQLGANGVADLIDRTCDHTRSLVLGIGSLPGAEVLWVPQINQGLVRFLDPHHPEDPSCNDAFTDRILAEILTAGDAFFTGTTWQGQRAMRVSVCNWQTSAADVELVIASVARTLHAARQTP